MRTVAVLCALALAASVALAQGPNQITNLPGAPANLPFKQYAGYIQVNAQNNRQLFYYFVESQNDPSTDPLILWQTGGPGCSSMLAGFSENGPLWVNPDGATLSLNPSAWNQIANVIYVESPAGVGFSYSDVPSDYTVGDARTAADIVAFMHGFLQMYPQYQGRPFWLTGESYGGHYVPNAALAIVNANAAGQQPNINLQGFQVGNAWTDAPLDNRGAVEFWWTHAMISDETHAGIDANCDFAHIGPLQGKARNASAADACSDYLSQSSADQVAINIYDVYTDVCVSSEAEVAIARKGGRAPRNVVPQQNAGSHLISQLARAEEQSAGAYKSPFSALNLRSEASRLPGDDPDPCVDNHLSTYLNTASVQMAIHANTTMVPTWYGCSPSVNYSYTDLLTSMLPVYNQLLDVQPPLRMLVYSGDVDGIVPVTGTRAWLAALNLPIVTPWHPWLLNKQTGGWAQEYDGLTFASVRNAGHMVPWTEPERSFALFSTFLSGQPI